MRSLKNDLDINLQQVQNKYMHIFNDLKLMIKPEHFQIEK